MSLHTSSDPPIEVSWSFIIYNGTRPPQTKIDTLSPTAFRFRQFSFRTFSISLADIAGVSKVLHAISDTHLLETELEAGGIEARRC